MKILTQMKNDHDSWLTAVFGRRDTKGQTRKEEPVGPDYCITEAIDYIEKAIDSLKLAGSWGRRTGVDIALLKAIKKNLHEEQTDDETRLLQRGHRPNSVGT